mmetsp:Transcript_37820/g.42349  ORF Transcript_37820/g.42349 Transcript_37820/m.42349 type:complete len:114 (+) Transcript_37820:160-501(+)|eukprot:CAMPEP_0170963290 /NCGR_PEP_ID=MMETSP0735-20130129/39485_1 /TAXON_ID=186038 /ORGANISM="Fragilariopsis kerguelensis, Strain L26-C5" /LENGTH=113 /DNA_ID=CAMNT_0011379921 /DNA_START=114 /DNA_END=455 /DNA_ORIENTATION=-
MPLLKIFSRKALTVSADDLHKQLAMIWKVPSNVLKILILPVHDMSWSSNTGGGDEKEIYIDVRAKAKPERTQDVIDTAMAQTQNLLQQYGYKATISVELCEPSLQSSLSAPYY